MNLVKGCTEQNLEFAWQQVIFETEGLEVPQELAKRRWLIQFDTCIKALRSGQVCLVANGDFKTAVMARSLSLYGEDRKMLTTLEDPYKNDEFDIADARCRTLVLMDATGSMGALLQKAKETVATMFDRADQILVKNKYKPGMIEMQFACFRNYDCKEDSLLQWSEWENKPQNLRKFMATIAAGGGTHWEEAVEIGLWHANQEADADGIDQVILIGDAAYNSKKQIDKGRNRYGEAYWKNTRFAARTNADQEVTKLIKRRVPVHAFYVIDNGKLKSCFSGIAKRTGGESEYLNVQSATGADRLTDVVTERVLFSIGGKAKGTDLIRQYRQKFS